MINIVVVAVKFDFEGLICLSCRQTIRILLLKKWGNIRMAKIEKFLLNFDLHLDIFKTKPFGFKNPWGFLPKKTPTKKIALNLSKKIKDFFVG